MKLKKKIKNIANRIKNRMLMAGLFLEYFLLKRGLQIKWISLPDPVVFRSNTLTMRWEVKGCYKIVINNKIELSGNTNFIQIDPAKWEGYLRLEFHGCGQKIEKKYVINSDVQPLKESMDLSLTSNGLITFQLQEQSLCLLLSELSSFRNPFAVRAKLIKLQPSLFLSHGINFSRLNIQLETFNQQQFNP